MTRETQAGGLTDAEWSLIKSLLPAPLSGGRPRSLDLRQVVDAILYLQASSCGWRQLPRRFPHPSSVRTYYDRWRKDGTWERVSAVLHRG
jgi:putative transposase